MRGVRFEAGSPFGWLINPREENRFNHYVMLMTALNLFIFGTNEVNLFVIDPISRVTINGRYMGSSTPRV